MPTAPNQAREMFLHAVGRLPPEQWPDYVARASAGNAQLQQQVEHLLQVHQEAGSFLSEPAGVTHSADDGAPGGTWAPPPLMEGPGDTIGTYRLLEQIGEGGFGVVFMAEQHQPLRRKVALKVIKAGMDTRQVIARFEAERQALALMDHPNIAKVLDAGATASGRPYFVMELVRGVPITAYCDEAHLNPRERLELFVHLCHAVQHAHQKGIIHRDIKPSNVLITLHDGKPVVKVIDFGIAKATGQQLTEKTLFTNFAQMVGTPLYMSPEQAGAGLDIDTRSDIYGLGVLLYELLTGSTPFDRDRLKSAAFEEIRRIIREEEPPRPSTRLSGSATLTSIAAMCRTEPRRLSHLFRGEVDWIVMKALEKDRNRRYETANGFAMDVQRYLNDEAVEACPPSATYRFRKFARRNKRSLITASVVAVMLLVTLGVVAGSIGWVTRDREARRAAIGREVSAAVTEAEGWQAEEKWPQALSAIQRAQGLLAAGGDDALGHRVRAMRGDLELVLRLEEIPLLRAETKDDEWDSASADVAYAAAFSEHGIDLDRLSVDEAASRIGARPAIAVALVHALDDWAFARLEMGSPGRAHLLAVAQAADADPWRRQVRDAARLKDGKALAALAASSELGRQSPGNLLTLWRAMLGRGELADRIRVLREAQRLHPADYWINLSLGMDLELSSRRGSEEAVAFLRAALALRPLSAGTHNALGNALSDLDRLEEAAACYRRAMELNGNYAGAHNNLGLIFKRQRKFSDAVEHYRKAIAIKPRMGIAHSNLGIALKEQGKFEEARASYLQAIAINPKHATAHASMGVLLHAEKKLDEAIAHLERAIAIDPNHLNGRIAYGNALRARGRNDVARAQFEAAIKIDPANDIAHNGLGLCRGDVGDTEGAIASFTRALELNPKGDSACINLGNAWKAKGKLNLAFEFYQKAIALAPENAVAHQNLGIVHQMKGQMAAAVACYGRSIELSPSADAHYGLAECLQHQKDFAGAIPHYREAIRLNPAYYAAVGGLGLAQLQLGQLEKSIITLNECLKLSPGYAAAQLNLGLALRRAKKPTEAQAAFEKAAVLAAGDLERDPDSINHRNNLGLSLENSGKIDEAIEVYREGNRLKPDYAAFHVMLGILLSDKKRDYPSAAASFRKAVVLEPGVPIHHYYLGNALHRTGDLNGAAASYRKAIELNSKHASSHHNLGLVLTAQRKYGEAIECFAKAIELRPGDANTHRSLGIALKGDGKFDDAIASHRRAIALAPEMATAHDSLGDALSAKGDVDGAIAAYREAARIDPNDAHYRASLHRALWRKGGFEEVISVSRAIYEQNPQAPDAGNRLSITLNNTAWYLVTCPDLKARNTSRAIELIDEADKLLPNAHWNTRGVVHYRDGDFKAAAAALEASITKDGGNSFDFFFLAMTLWQQGDKDAARAKYNLAVEWMEKNKPGNEELLRFRAEAAALLGVQEKKD